MSKANENALGDLHGELARVIKNAIGKDYTSEDNPQGLPPAALLNVARQFLKDNLIVADPHKNPDLGALADALPDFDAEEDEQHIHH